MQIFEFGPFFDTLKVFCEISIILGIILKQLGCHVKTLDRSAYLDQMGETKTILLACALLTTKLKMKKLIIISNHVC